MRPVELTMNELALSVAMDRHLDQGKCCLGTLELQDVQDVSVSEEGIWVYYNFQYACRQCSAIISVSVPVLENHDAEETY